MNAQTGSITVHVKGLESSVGNVEIGLYNSESSFAIYDQNYKGATVAVTPSGVSYTFRNLPVGTYAVAVWHDENKNKVLDENWIGVPTENYGFSLNKYGTFGPPNFKDVSFKINQGKLTTLTITLK